MSLIWSANVGFFVSTAEQAYLNIAKHAISHGS